MNEQEIMNNNIIRELKMIQGLLIKILEKVK